MRSHFLGRGVNFQYRAGFVGAISGFSSAPMAMSEKALSLLLHRGRDSHLA
jgi:hypothetical protein